MLNAKKYREMADLYWENNADKIQPILDEIQKGAKDGLYVVQLQKGTTLNDRQRYRLMRMGFDVKVGKDADNNPIYTVIMLGEDD